MIQHKGGGVVVGSKCVHVCGGGLESIKRQAGGTSGVGKLGERKRGIGGGAASLGGPMGKLPSGLWPPH